MLLLEIGNNLQRLQGSEPVLLFVNSLAANSASDSSHWKVWDSMEDVNLRPFPDHLF